MHFDPKLVSREILERQFGVLFRPNFFNYKKQSESDYMVSVGAVAQDCLGSCRPQSRCHLSQFPWAFCRWTWVLGDQPISKL